MWVLKPNFEVTCPQCGEQMFIRRSELCLPRRNYRGRIQVIPTLEVMFKCLLCAHTMWFLPNKPYIDSDYWNEALKIRNHFPMWVPPPETWSNDAKVQQRLKDLGYLGGDIKYNEVTDMEEK